MWGQLFQGCPFLGRERANMGTLTLEWEGQSMGMPVVLYIYMVGGALGGSLIQKKDLGILWGEDNR